MDVAVNAPGVFLTVTSPSSTTVSFPTHNCSSYGHHVSSSSSPLGGLRPLRKQQQQQQQQSFRERLVRRYHHHRHGINIRHCFHKPNPIIKGINFINTDASSSVFTSATSSASAVSIGSSSSTLGLLEVREIRERSNKWQWKGHTINYFVHGGEEKGPDNNGNPSSNSTPNSNSTSNSRPPLLLVHGFGASIAHWRRNIMTLSQSYTVYAIDLLGFGASDKPVDFEYTMEVWAQLILDFLDEIVQRPTVLIGNSVGSLACVIAASEPTQSLVRGLVLLNCAGGMNNKAIVDDWRIKLLLPLLWFFDFLLKQRGIASLLFDRVKQRDNLRNILFSVYGNKEFVDEDLIEIIREPTHDDGALDAFVSIVTGPPGPNPVQLMPRITLPVLVLWGDQDPFTPLDGPVGKYFLSLPSQQPNIRLFVLEGVGHCPHDDRPDLVHENLLPWLTHLPVT
uniref:AB hydrolase-1 domain-containing protein n=1 Tax=Davidia involucrata TaxID=16924 RepID=A0A5B6YXH6_DAVIN